MIDGLTFEEMGSGPETIVFLHGIGGDATAFHHQLPAFDGYRRIAWNMPGYLGSELRMNPPDFAHLSSRLAKFIDGIGGPVHLVGHSIGGMVAIEHGLDHIEQVSSLTLVATTPRFGGRDDSFKTAFLADRLGMLDAGRTMADVATHTAPNLLATDAAPAEVAHVARALANVPETTWRGILQCLVTFDRVADLPALDLPTLVIAGECDQNAPLKTMQKMAAALPNARFHIVKSAGHLPHQEHPAAFNALLQAFLSELSTT